MLDDLKNKIKDVMATDLSPDFLSKSQTKASGQWIDGKFVPNEQLEQQDMYQQGQPMQQDMYQQGQPMQQNMYQQGQPMQQDMYQQGQPMQQNMYQQGQPMQQDMYQQGLPMQQDMYQQGQPMQQNMYQQPMPMQQGMYPQVQPMQQSNPSPSGQWVNGKWVPAGEANPQAGQQYQGGLMCPKCKSHNVNVQMVEVGSTTKTKKSGVGLGGHAHNAMRTGAAMVTLGASNLVIKKATGTEKGKTKTKNETYCICQNCGHSWKKK